jgi:hypothetical protein
MNCVGVGIVMEVVDTRFKVLRHFLRENEANNENLSPK